MVDPALKLPALGPSDRYRLPQDAADPRTPKRWLSECQRNHSKCHAYVRSIEQAERPSRLIDVGPPDGSIDPWLDERPVSGPYLTLSYCWGDRATITRTTSETLAHFKRRMPMSTLSQIFQDAIAVTRSMSVRYIWIDALCILQDSSEDVAKELGKMADIYAASLFTISASISTSGMSTLFESRKLYNMIQLPRTASQNGHPSYITNQVFHNFASDVPRGHLGTRGWCFQERLLAPRLLHFGRDQRHWECHEGIWSECSSERQWYDESTDRDDGNFRETLLSISQAPFAEDWRPSGEELGQDANVRLAAVWKDMQERVERLRLENVARARDRPTESAQRKQHYDSWYKLVSAYSRRSLTQSTDKLPALAGAASRFNDSLKDSYAAGIWTGDLMNGLLWSRRSFERVEVDESTFRRPGIGGRCEQTRRAPSWSWPSVDGAVNWVNERDGLEFLKNAAVMMLPDPNKNYGEPDFAALRLRGIPIELQKISSLRHSIGGCEEPFSDLEDWFDTVPERHRPQADFDDPYVEGLLREAGSTRPLYFLLLSAVPPQSGTHEVEGRATQPMVLGYALMLRWYPADSACRRVGLARVALRDFLGAESQDIDIL